MNSFHCRNIAETGSKKRDNKDRSVWRRGDPKACGAVDTLNAGRRKHHPPSCLVRPGRSHAYVHSRAEMPVAHFGGGHGDRPAVGQLDLPPSEVRRFPETHTSRRPRHPIDPLVGVPNFRLASRFIRSLSARPPPRPYLPARVRAVPRCRPLRVSASLAARGGDASATAEVVGRSQVLTGGGSASPRRAAGLARDRVVGPSVGVAATRKRFHPF